MAVDMSALQARFDEEQAKGYRGARVDPNPNSAYSQETDPMTSPRAPRHGETFLHIDEYADPDNPYIGDIHGRAGLDEEDIEELGTQTITNAIAAQATAGTAGAAKKLGEAQFDGEVTAATFTPNETITGDETNNRTFKVYNKTADHALFTVTTTETKTADVAAALSADGSDQSVSAGDVIECRQSVGGTGVAHAGGSFTVTVQQTDTEAA